MGSLRAGWLLLALLTAALPARVCARGEAEPARGTFFLPKSPAAAAYVLGRLSNLELVEAPRSEPVYLALLQRDGLERKYRLEALDGLARLRNTDRLTELIRGITELSGKGEPAEPVLRELAGLLLPQPPAELGGKRAVLEKLADTAESALGRQIAWAAMITADGSTGTAWHQAEPEPARLADLLRAVPLVRQADLRASLRSRIEPLLQQAEPAEVRRAAITAIPALPGHDTETFKTLAALVEAGIERPAAIASLQRIPRAAWPKEAAGELVQSLVSYLQSLPVEQRTAPEPVNAFQLATDLTPLLPPDQAGITSKALRALGVSVFVLRTLKEQMLFDRTLIVVETGKPVELVLVNDDAMPHNLVIVTPGALEEVGQAAEKLPPAPDSQGRLYIPDSPHVLHATRLVEPGQRARLAFTAPDEPGEYRYVCTFPGHWRRMVGTLAVVKDVEAYLAAHAATAGPKVTEWKLDDLLPDLDKLGAGRDLMAGRALFTRLACVQCHKLGTDGYAYGPDLTEVFQRWKGDPASVLQQILDPSKVIEDRYRPIEFDLVDGDDVTGLVVQEEGDRITLQTGAADTLIQTLKKSDIKERRPLASSVMPVGLLNTLSKDEILDLLAYLESGGSVTAHAHAHKP